MKKPSFACLLVVAVAACGALYEGHARAHVLEFYGQLRAGGGSGKGLGGDQQDADFFKAAAGPSYGALIGIEVFWIDFWIEHDQFTDFSRINGTWTEFMLGADFPFALSSAPSKNEQPKWWGLFGFGVGFGIGTGQQIMPPLDNAQISDKGFMGEAKLSLEYRFSEAVAMGVTVPVTYGYMFKNGVAANDVSNQYQSLHALALLYLQFKFGYK